MSPIAESQVEELSTSLPISPPQEAAEGDEVSPQPPSLQIRQTQSPQLLLDISSSPGISSVPLLWTSKVLHILQCWGSDPHTRKSNLVFKRYSLSSCGCNLSLEGKRRNIYPWGQASYQAPPEFCLKKGGKANVIMTDWENLPLPGQSFLITGNHARNKYPARGLQGMDWSSQMREDSSLTAHAAGELESPPTAEPVWQTQNQPQQCH